MGYRFQFVTLAGFHSLNLSMFNLARGYKDRGMAAYSELQQAEFAAEAEGYTATRHQREVGVGYFDAVAMAISGGKSSTTAFAGSTEADQFHDHGERYRRTTVMMTAWCTTTNGPSPRNKGPKRDLKGPAAGQTAAVVLGGYTSAAGLRLRRLCAIEPRRIASIRPEVLGDADRFLRGFSRRCSTNQEGRMPTAQREPRLAFTVTWEVRDGEVEAAAEIVARFIPEARKEPGLELLVVNQCVSDQRQFLFYEVFKDAAAFEAHQQTPHFKTLILEEALPRLSKRERVQYIPL